MSKRALNPELIGIFKTFELFLDDLPIALIESKNGTEWAICQLIFRNGKLGEGHVNFNIIKRELGSDFFGTQTVINCDKSKSTDGKGRWVFL
jgi:hypothetical protein